MALKIRENDPTTVAQILRPYLERTEGDSRPVVLMMCGIAGISLGALRHQISRLSKMSRLWQDNSGEGGHETITLLRSIVD